MIRLGSEFCKCGTACRHLLVAKFGNPSRNRNWQSNRQERVISWQICKATWHSLCFTGYSSARCKRMNYKTYCVVSGILFSLVALAHLLRISYSVSIQVDDVAVPMLASWIGLFIPASLAAWAFRITRESEG
jgi:hypothetical protein